MAVTPPRAGAAPRGLDVLALRLASHGSPPSASAAVADPVRADADAARGPTYLRSCSASSRGKTAMRASSSSICRRLRREAAVSRPRAPRDPRCAPAGRTHLRSRFHLKSV